MFDLALSCAKDSWLKRLRLEASVDKSASIRSKRACRPTRSVPNPLSSMFWMQASRRAASFRMSAPEEYTKCSEEGFIKHPNRHETKSMPIHIESKNRASNYLADHISTLHREMAAIFCCLASERLRAWTMVAERSLDEMRLQSISDELARSAGFAELPDVFLRPAGQMPGVRASAISDLNAILASASIVDLDDDDIRCILAHELGHLKFRHKGGSFFLALLTIAFALTGGFVCWMVWNLQAGIAFFLLSLFARYWFISRWQTAYRENWSREAIEIEAETFARDLVGEGVYVAFCARNRSRPLTESAAPQGSET